MPSERRRHSRVLIQAQVCISEGDRVVELEALDASASGLFLEANPAEHPRLRVGVEVDVRIYAEDTSEESDILVIARIARIERSRRGPKCSGFALEFVEMGTEDAARL